jgi:hypothetical protein
MRHTAPAARRLLSLFLVALIVFPNLFIPPTAAASASSSTQAQVRLYGYVKNQFGATVSGALVTIGGQAAGSTTTGANGYYQFTLFAGCFDLYEFKAFFNVVNGAQMGQTVSVGGCFLSDYPLPDIIYNQTPSNGKIAYNKWGVVYTTPEDGVYLINPDGTGDTKIPGTERDHMPVWSPDGTRLAFYRILSESYGAGIYVVNADGTGLRHFGGDVEYNTEPDWSPDGTRLAFRSQRNGGSIEIINADGTGRVDLTGEPNYYTSPRWQPTARPNTPAGANVSVTAGGVRLTFSGVTAAGQTTVRAIDPNALRGMPGEYVINGNSLAFEITTTAAYTGPITIGFHVPGVADPNTFGTLRVLHGEPSPAPYFVDRTILAPDAPAPDFAARMVYARVTSLSPFIVAERVEGGGDDQAAPDISIAAPVADAVYLLRQNVGASYACADAGSGVASCVGTVASGASLDTAAVGSFNFTVSARDHAGNKSTRTVNYRVAYSVNPLFDQTKAHQRGSTVPVRVELTDAGGLNSSASNVVVTALSVTRISDNAPGALAAPGDASPDYNFRYAGGSYHFNLKTSGYATGTYLLSFKAGADPTTHTVQFQVK